MCAEWNVNKNNFSVLVGTISFSAVFQALPVNLFAYSGSHERILVKTDIYIWIYQKEMIVKTVGKSGRFQML